MWFLWIECCGWIHRTGEEIGADGAKKTLVTATALVLQSNLEQYQKQCVPKVATRICLACVKALYQYTQPHRTDKALKLLWTANVAMSLILSKLTFGLMQPSSIMLSINEAVAEVAQNLVCCGTTLQIRSMPLRSDEPCRRQFIL